MKPRGEESEPASSASRPAGHSRPLLRQVFEQFDENKDGEISREEMARALRRLGLAPSSDRELSDILAQADHNRDGVVDFAEFSDLYRSIQLQGKEGRDRHRSTRNSSNHDNENNEGDDKEEEKEEDDDDESLLEAFRVFDQDGDGFIRAEELHSVLSAMGILHGRTLSDCRTMISSFDSDGNGRVDFQEFKKMMGSRW